MGLSSREVLLPGEFTADRVRNIRAYCDFYTVMSGEKQRDIIPEICLVKEIVKQHKSLLDQVSEHRVKLTPLQIQRVERRYEQLQTTSLGDYIESIKQWISAEVLPFVCFTADAESGGPRTLRKFEDLELFLPDHMHYLISRQLMFGPYSGKQDRIRQDTYDFRHLYEDCKSLGIELHRPNATLERLRRLFTRAS